MQLEARRTLLIPPTRPHLHDLYSQTFPVHIAYLDSPSLLLHLHLSLSFPWIPGYPFPAPLLLVLLFWLTGTCGFPPYFRLRFCILSLTSPHTPLL
ncbi:hypothetical protein VTO73DRAFT_596 [Trametes versicolor]